MSGRKKLDYSTRRVLENVNHGIPNGYKRGCRCKSCTEANYLSQRDTAKKYREKKIQDPEWREKAREASRVSMRKMHAKDPEAYNARVREALAKKKAILNADPNHPDHGKNSSYTAGCRCAACTEARRVYAREHRARVAPRSLTL